VLAILALGQPPRWLSGVYVALVGGALALVGAAVVLAPWLDRIGRQLNAERDERIRSEERAAVAAHLHDSVLQTLALIQRSADDPRRTVTLARRQERQLRSWLYGDTAEPAALSRAVATVAVEVEETHDVDVDPVVVGDAPVDDQLAGLVAALREAVVNAAKHAGVEEVSVYVEVEPDAVSAFIRDRGKGFDPAVVPSDRHGIAASIVARMQRLGGEAEIDAAPGHGTEVRLRLPRQPAAALRATRPPERRR
jgi:signal transduction histidine kinase